MVARQAAGTRRISPLGRLIWAQSASRAAKRGPGPGRAAEHAAAAGQHLDVVHVHAQGNLRQRQAIAHGRRPPSRRFAPGRPPSAPPGPGCTASRRRRSAARRSGAVRLGSYWIESTRAGTPSLLRRKSIRR